MASIHFLSDQWVPVYIGRLNAKWVTLPFNESFLTASEHGFSGRKKKPSPESNVNVTAVSKDFERTIHRY